jgi:hypothetical protein
MREHTGQSETMGWVQWAGRLAACEGSAEVQSVLVAAHALLWYFAIPWLAQHVARPWMDRQQFKQRWAAQWRQRLASANGVELDADYAYSFSLEKLGVALQHGLGALLQLPALLGLVSPELGAALACHGALTEVGWELQDLACRMYGHYLGGAVGRSRNPATLVRYTVLHHALGLTLVVPLNCYLRGQHFFRLGVFTLMGNASFSLLLQSVSFALDVETASGLAKMQLVSLLVFAVMLVMRGYLFVLVLCSAVPVVWAAAPLPAFGLALAAASAMAYINFIMTRDAARKVIKYWLHSPTPAPAAAPVPVPVPAPVTEPVPVSVPDEARPTSVKLLFATAGARPTSARRLYAPGNTRILAPGSSCRARASLPTLLRKRTTG